MVIILVAELARQRHIWNRPYWDTGRINGWTILCLVWPRGEICTSSTKTLTNDWDFPYGGAKVQGHFVSVRRISWRLQRVMSERQDLPDKPICTQANETKGPIDCKPRNRMGNQLFALKVVWFCDKLRGERRCGSDRPQKRHGKGKSVSEPHPVRTYM